MAGRKRGRTELIQTMRVEHRTTGELVGVLININPDGMMLIVEDAPAKETLLQLRIHLPKQLMEKDFVDVSGNVRWVREHIDGTHQVGIRIEAGSAEMQQDIAEVVSRFHQQEHSEDEISDPNLRRIDGSDIV